MITRTAWTRTQKGILAAATVGNFVGATPALYSIFGLVLIPIADEFNWPRAKVSGALAIVALLSGVMNLLIGPLLDRVSVRRLALAGNLCFGLALLLFTFTPASWTAFYGLFILAGFCSAFATPMVFSKVVASWFDQGRGTALGFAGGLGNGAGSALLPMLAGSMIAMYGWRIGYRSVAIAVLLLGFPVLYRFLRDPAKNAPSISKTIAPPAEGMCFGEALRSRTFWLLLLTIGTCAAGLTAMFGQVVPVLAEQGVDIGHSVQVITVFSLVCAAWQLGMGHLLDRVGSPWVMVPFYLIAVAGLWLLHHTHNQAWLLLAGAMMGLGLGAEFGAMPLLISRYFGLRSYGAIAGTLYALVSVAQGLVPLAMNAVYDQHRTYAPALTALETVIVIASILLLGLPHFAGQRQLRNDDVDQAIHATARTASSVH